MATAIQSLGYLSAFRSLAVDPHVTVARYALDSTVLPLVQDALPFAEQVRRSLIRNRMDTSHSEAITGKTADGLPLAGHRHAHYLATDEDRDGRLDHVTIYAPGGFEAGDVEALGRVTCIFRQGNRPEVRMVLTGLGGREELADVPLFANSRRWRSVTPFALPRFANRGGGKPPRPRDLPEAQLARELRSRGWPERVQLCLQGLLLRENGYECDEGAPLLRRRAGARPGAFHGRTHRAHVGTAGGGASDGGFRRDSAAARQFAEMPAFVRWSASACRMK